MVKELVEAARRVEMATLRKRRVPEKASIEECWENTVKGPSWVDTNEGGKENPERRCSLIAKEIKRDERGNLFAVMPPLEARKNVFALGEGPGMRLDFEDAV